MTFLRRTKNSESKRNQMKRTLHNDDIVEYYVFSVSLTGIVKLPPFKRWIRVCINKLLVCSLIHDFAIWRIFLLISNIFILHQLKVAEAQTFVSNESEHRDGASIQRSIDTTNERKIPECICQHGHYCLIEISHKYYSLVYSWYVHLLKGLWV